MLIQLFVFALFFAGFGLFAIIRKKRLIGFTFLLLGFMLFSVAIIAVYLYPDKSPF